MDQHKDINTYMDALEHIGPVKPTEEFLQKMEHMAAVYVTKHKRPSRLFLLSMAASFLLVAAANIYVVSHTRAKDRPIEMTHNYYDSIIPIKSLYNE